jgi:hypothetical protein
MLRMFGLVKHGDREVLHGDSAAPVVICEQLIGANAVLAGSLAGLKQSGWADVDPIDVCLGLLIGRQRLRLWHDHQTGVNR